MSARKKATTTAQPRKAAPEADDLDARVRRIHQRLLDAIDATLDELAQPCAQRAALADAAWARHAPLHCPQAACRRAKCCRCKPCAVHEAATVAKQETSRRARRAPRQPVEGAART